MKTIPKIDGNVIRFPKNGRTKLNAAELRNAVQILVEHDHAAAEHRAATIRLRVAERKLLAFVDKVGRPTMARAVRVGKGPTDKFGDALYGLCQGCGGLVTRYINTRGESIGMGHPTERCPKCKFARPRK